MSKKRKTRQEKKIAELRRLLATQKSQPQESFSSEPQETVSLEKSQISPQKPSGEKLSTLTVLDKKLIQKDLSKTLILSLLAISLEVVVYMILRQA